MLQPETTPTERAGVPAPHLGSITIRVQPEPIPVSLEIIPQAMPIPEARAADQGLITRMELLHPLQGQSIPIAIREVQVHPEVMEVPRDPLAPIAVPAAVALRAA